MSRAARWAQIDASDRADMRVWADDGDYQSWTSELPQYRNIDGFQDAQADTNSPIAHSCRSLRVGGHAHRTRAKRAYLMASVIGLQTRDQPHGSSLRAESCFLGDGLRGAAGQPHTPNPKGVMQPGSLARCSWLPVRHPTCRASPPTAARSSATTQIPGPGPSEINLAVAEIPVV